MRKELEAKLLANRRIEDCGYETPCWIWIRSHNRAGYGKAWMSEDKRLVAAHRLAAHVWLSFELDSPDFVLHRCDNPPCVNPAHLFVGTPLDNMRDMIAKERQNFPGGGAGEKNGRSKLTATDVLAIRALLAKGVYQYVIAAEFDVTQTLISMIARGKIWQHV